MENKMETAIMEYLGFRVLKELKKKMVATIMGCMGTITRILSSFLANQTCETNNPPLPSDYFLVHRVYSVTHPRYESYAVTFTALS